MFRAIQLPAWLSSSGTLLNNQLGVILINVAFQLGFCTFVLSNYMKTIPAEIYESARVDGASVTRQFFQLTLPLCRPPLAALATLQVTWIYNEFFWATVLLQSGDKFPITSSLNSLQGQFFTDYNLLSAGSVLAHAARVDHLLRAAAAVRVRPDAGEHEGMSFPFDGIALGCDYNPEQWPRAVWREDVRLMQAAGVGFVTLGVFSWALLEPRPGEFDFGWFDEVVGLLADGGIAIDMATATAAPPPWLTTAHPEILPVDHAGHTLWPGSRQSWCPSSPVFREHALALVEQMARRYGSHPAVRLWHVSNELGCHNGRCWCDVSAAAFRRWLAERYGDIEKLNDAWGTAFWSQHYATFDEVLPPRITPAVPNPTQQLDFARFSSDALLDYYRAERDVLRRHSTVPVTTNFMISAHQSEQDYFAWAPEWTSSARTTTSTTGCRTRTPSRRSPTTSPVASRAGRGCSWSRRRRR